MPGLARVSSPSVSEPAVIELHGVRAGYDGRTVIDNVDLTVRRGELVALVGANGAGKSTLLKVIVGLLRPYEGSVSVLGSAPGASARRLAYLPQAEAVHWDYPLRVEDVVLMGRVAHAAPGRGPSSADRDAARTALGRVQADDLARRPIQALSGGQRQRVLLARTLASDPELLLLDEPATGVDPATEEQLMSLLGDLASHGRTVLVSTHDLASVMAHFPRVLAMNGGIVADGDASILRDDAILRRTYTGDLLGIRFGDVLGVAADQLVLAAVTAAVVLLGLWIIWRQLVFVSFDPIGAAAAGLNTLRYDTLLLGLIGLAIAVSVQIVGVVLVVAMLVTPAATARLLAQDLRALVIGALAVAVLSSVAGIWLSYYVNAASGGTIVLVATTLFGLVWIARSVARGRVAAS